MSATICNSQPSEWGKLIRTLDSTTFVFKNDFLRINGNATALEAGDAIGVFSDNGSNYECVGFTIIPNFIDSFLRVTAYKRDSSLRYGFKEGSKFKLLYWHKTLNCQLEIARKINNDSLLYENNYFQIDSLKTNITTIQYSQSTYYQSDSFGYATPLITLKPSDIPITYNFKSKVEGLSIFEYSGQIDLKASIAPREYIVQFTSSYCMSTSDSTLMTDSIKVLILQDTIPKNKDSLNIDSVTFDSILPTCTKAGSLLVSQKNIIGAKPFFFQLQHQLSQKVYTSNSGNFDELPSGIYKLEVSDSSGATATFHTPIVLQLSEDCTTNPVLTPDNKNGLQTLYISEVGNVKIMDREGKTIRELPVPGEWDGTDGKGTPAQMGDYYLFLNGLQYKIVTIIR